MPAGGYQKPKKPAGVSGPGKFSKRTDGQAKRVEGLDSPDMQYGDRQMLEAAQSAAPIRGAAGAEVRRPKGHAASGSRLPSFMFDMESSSPDEPATAGMDMGAGPGSELLAAATPPEDEREIVLTYLQDVFQNEDATKMLADLRNQRTQPAAERPLPSGPTLDDQPVGLA